MKRDYSKPIRDECRNCGAPSKEMRAGAPVWCVSPTCGAGFIPVFAEIPEGQRPPTNEPGNDDVTVWPVDIERGGIAGRRLDVAMGPSGRDFIAGVAAGWCEPPCADDWPPQVRTLADAVRWVAEGKRP